MFRDFSAKPYPMFRDFFGEKVTHWSGTPPYTLLGEYPPPPPPPGIYRSQINEAVWEIVLDCETSGFTQKK